MYDLIVIGAGPGGYEAAGHAGRMGKKVALIERGCVGGTCLNVGCIPAKTFLRSSKLFHECKEAAKYGVRLGSVEFDMPAVVERKNRVVGTLTKGVEGMLKRAGVEVITGHARLISRGVVEVGAARYEAANILLATGSRPAARRFPESARKACSIPTRFSLSRMSRRKSPSSAAAISAWSSPASSTKWAPRSPSMRCCRRSPPDANLEISTRMLQIMKRAGIEFNLSAKVLESKATPFVTRPPTVPNPAQRPIAS